MERRILAELFVEDDRAIEEDLGTIDYVEREAGWMSESGISVGQMRILDDDDPEDAKASDLADKIFNSEENKPTKVWVVTSDLTYNYRSHVEFEIFSDYKMAKNWFDQSVAGAKEGNALIALGKGVISTCGACVFQIDSSEGPYGKDYERIMLEERTMY